MKQNNQAWCAAVITLCMYGLYTLLRLHINHSDISSFITAGDFFVDNKRTPSEISILKGSYGYDGEFYYRLALDPLTQKAEDFGVRFDNPAFRQQRIGYPLLVWTLSAGNKAAVPALMVLVNLICLGGISFIGALMAKQKGKSALWGCVITAYPGFMMSYGRNLAEIVTAFWIIAGIYALHERRALLAAIIFTIATFCRETSLLVPAGAGLFFLYCYVKNERSIKVYPWHLMLLPLVLHIAWIQFLSMRWNMPPISGGAQDIGLPFVGIFNFLQSNLANNSLLSKVNIFFFLFCMVTFVVSATALKQSEANINIKISWSLYTALLLLLSNVIWLSFGEFTRAFTETFLLSVLIILGWSPRRAWIYISYSAYVILSWVTMGIYFLR